MFKPWQLFTLGLMSSMLLCLVSSYDIEQAEADVQLYCDMTTEGSWPSFNNAIECIDKR
ncbi:MAG: hypothetical protein ACRC6V_02130 [Bacteroidales bacterium]